jgi:hypothetical protein
VTVAFPGIRGQTQIDDWIDFSGTITAGGTAQTVLPQQLRRLAFYFQNLSIDNMYLGFGPPRPIATLSSGTISGITMPGAAGGGNGRGWSVTPQVVISGGIIDGDYQQAPGANAFGGAQAVGVPAQAHAVMTGSAPNMSVSSIVVDNPGSGYLVAPLVTLVNNAPQLGGGSCLPVSGATPSGIEVVSGSGYFSMMGSFLVPASQVSVVGAATGDAFICKVGGLTS